VGCRPSAQLQAEALLCRQLQARAHPLVLQQHPPVQALLPRPLAQALLQRPLVQALLPRPLVLVLLLPRPRVWWHQLQHLALLLGLPWLLWVLLLLLLVRQRQGQQLHPRVQAQGLLLRVWLLRRRPGWLQQQVDSSTVPQGQRPSGFTGRASTCWHSR
jgi:hypothetical protein